MTESGFSTSKASRAATPVSLVFFSFRRAQSIAEQSPDPASFFINADIRELPPILVQNKKYYGEANPLSVGASLFSARRQTFSWIAEPCVRREMQPTTAIRGLRAVQIYEFNFSFYVFCFSIRFTSVLLSSAHGFPSSLCLRADVYIPSLGVGCCRQSTLASLLRRQLHTLTV